MTFVENDGYDGYDGFYTFTHEKKKKKIYKRIDYPSNSSYPSWFPFTRLHTITERIQNYEQSYPR